MQKYDKKAPNLFCNKKINTPLIQSTYIWVEKPKGAA